MVYNPNGNRVLGFKWSLGIASKNQVEALALYQGLKLRDTKRIKNIIAIKELSIVIRFMVSESQPSNDILERIIGKAKNEA